MGDPKLGDWWVYPKGQWSGPLVMRGNCEGCRRTLALRLPGHRALVIALWRFPYDPDCYDCQGSR